LSPYFIVKIVLRFSNAIQQSISGIFSEKTMNYFVRSKNIFFSLLIASIERPDRFTTAKAGLKAVKEFEAELVLKACNTAKKVV